MPAAPRARFIPDLLRTHAEDLAFLWSQRREALTSARHTLREFGQLNERMEAHVQGLLVADAPTLAGLLQAQLASTDRDEVFAAAYAFLRRADQGLAHAVLVEFSRAKGSTLAGLRDALSMAPQEAVLSEVQSALAQAKPATALAAAVVLANQRKLDAASPRLQAWLEDVDPELAAWAWRAVLVADAFHATPAPPATRPYQLAVTHKSPEVRHAGWAAAAWAGKSTMMSLLRQRVAAGDEVALHWLAVLAHPDDVPVVQKAALALPDVARRCALLARFGHPSALNALVRWMAPDNVPLAVAAGEAFTRITGVDVRGQRTVIPVADDADDFTREMAPSVWLPDADKALSVLTKRAAEWSGGSRWCQGVRLDGEITREQVLTLDLQARWDVAARSAMAGRVISAPPLVY